MTPELRESLRTIRFVLAEYHQATLRKDHRKRPGPPAYRARVRVGADVWTFTAEAHGTNEITVALFRRAPPEWLERGFTFQTMMSLEYTFQFSLVTTPQVIGIQTTLPASWDLGAVGQRLEMLTDAAKMLWADAMGPQ